MGRQAAFARQLDRGGHQQADRLPRGRQRLVAGLRLPVLAMQAGLLPGRRGLRAVLFRDARAGRRAGDDQRKLGLEKIHGRRLRHPAARLL